jgi:hypothetical protein
MKDKEYLSLKQIRDLVAFTKCLPDNTKISNHDVTQIFPSLKRFSVTDDVIQLHFMESD